MNNHIYRMDCSFCHVDNEDVCDRCGMDDDDDDEQEDDHDDSASNFEIMMSMSLLKGATTMGQRGRCLRVGQAALTDYNGPGKMVRVTIVEADYKRTHGHSQSWIMYRVTPPLKNGTIDSWYDADWFEPAPPMQETVDMFKTPNVNVSGPEQAQLAEGPTRPQG